MAHLPLTLVYRQKFVLDSLKESSATKLKIAETCVSEIMKAMDIRSGSNRTGETSLNAFNSKGINDLYSIFREHATSNTRHVA